ncbi:glutamyl-tRNA reductase [Clostridium sp. D2Q-11]|uniref:Glutamyl-tRNA reductase n=1 Tax=Anaeromonas frigoriresistens TaxID=2683708 RepID=A0A942UXE8_9FIRM|nr:glutamyl-tRNA reductase [Anaeromonas frigoriresistens]MBS4538579.1 glutamyl-tRNA reductase [Anaeromonas frigoriresistens]
MKIAVVGINHDTAITEVREKVSFTDTKKIDITNYLLDNGVKECVILSTCNRSEIYIADTEDNIDKSIESVKKVYEEKAKPEEINKYLFIKEDIKAIYHLYEVTSGLKSIVLGEDQILGQVKEAHLLAMELGGSQKTLNKLFREAITTSKKVKNKLKISEHPLSISYIGVKFLNEHIQLKGKKALVIGLGKMGKLSLKYLINENLSTLYMSNRSHGKLVNIQDEYPNVIPISYEQRYEILKEVDILITATACPHHIICKEDMPKLTKKLYVMDMALPRDVDQRLSQLDFVNLYNIDNLKEIVTLNESKRKELSEKAKNIIDQDVLDFIQWLKTLKVDPIIKNMYEKCQEVEKDTMEYINRKIDLSKRDKKIIEKIISSSFKRIIRNPAIKLKEIEDKEKLETYIKVMEELYGL